MKKYLLFLTFCCSFGFGGEILYPSEVKQLYLNFGDKTAVGRLLPTAKVEVLETKDNFVKLKISGFIQNGKNQALYENPKTRILNAAFKVNSGVKYEILDEKLNEVTAILWSENENLHKNLDELMKKANTLFSENCAMCHAIHKIDEYNANQWPSIFKSMADRTAIEKKDRFLVEQFLQKSTNKE